MFVIIKSLTFQRDVETFGRPVFRNCAFKGLKSATKGMLEAVVVNQVCVAQAVLWLKRSCSTMTIKPPLFRLHGKQRWPRETKNGHPHKKAAGAGCAVKQASRKSLRCKAVAEGVLPKARRPFALFMLEKSKVKKGSSRKEFLDEMQLLGTLWSALSEAEKEKYKVQSKNEFNEQRHAMRVCGLKLRKPSLQGEVGKGQQAEQSETQVSEQTPVAFGSLKLLQAQPPQLGEGSYGSVFLATDAYNRKCAVKVFKGKTDVDDLKHEVRMVKTLRQDLKYSQLSWFPSLYQEEAAKNPFPFLAFEYCGVSLQTLLAQGPCNNQTVLAISKQLQGALTAMHAVNVLHLDVKPANILWTQETGQLKLTDFGMAEIVGKASFRFVNYVTSLYRPPELWNAEMAELQKALRPSVDMWSYGCVVYETIARKPLMGPLSKQGGCEQTVQLWAKDWSAIKGQKPIPHTYGQASRLQFRLRLAGSLISTLLASLQPDPSMRAWCNFL